VWTQQYKKLHQSRDTASNWGKRSKTERSGDYSHGDNLPRGNWNSCIGRAVADKHSRSTQTQEHEPPASRARGEHREQSLHGFTVTRARLIAESHKEA